MTTLYSTQICTSRQSSPPHPLSPVILSPTSQLYPSTADDGSTRLPSAGPIHTPIPPSASRLRVKRDVASLKKGCRGSHTSFVPLFCSCGGSIVARYIHAGTPPCRASFDRRLPTLPAAGPRAKRSKFKEGEVLLLDSVSRTAPGQKANPGPVYGPCGDTLRRPAGKAGVPLKLLPSEMPTVPVSTAHTSKSKVGRALRLKALRGLVDLTCKKYRCRTGGRNLCSMLHNTYCAWSQYFLFK
jgi:hypothetical protein